MIWRRTILAFSTLIFIAGCLEPPPPPRPSRPKPELVLKVDGEEVRMPLELLSVYLSENKNIPETFEIDSPLDYSRENELDPPDVMLVGEFPKTLRIGYSEHWELLFDKPVKLLSYGGARESPRASTLKLPGKPRMNVIGGSITFEDIWYARIRSKSNPTISGTIRIRVRTDQGVREYPGTIAVRCMGWG